MIVFFALLGARDAVAKPQIVDASFCGEELEPCTGQCMVPVCTCDLSGPLRGNPPPVDPRFALAIRLGFSGWLDTPRPDPITGGPFDGCVSTCVPGPTPQARDGNLGDSYCPVDPPSEGTAPVCLPEEPPFERPSSCPQWTCDPPQPDELTPTSIPGGVDPSLPVVPLACQQAMPNEGWWDDCDDIFTDAEDSGLQYLVQHFGASANQYCIAATGSLFCQDGKYCDYRNSAFTTCTMCDANGDCYRYRTNTEGAATPELDEARKTETASQFVQDECEGKYVCLVGDDTVTVTIETVLNEVIDAVYSIFDFIDSPSAAPWTPEQRAEFQRERMGQPREPTPQQLAEQRDYDGHGGSEPVVPSRPSSTRGAPAPPNPARNAAQTGSLRHIEWQTNDGQWRNRRQPAPKANAPTATLVGDPVHLASGQLVDSAIDLEIAGRQPGGLHFRLERFYDSGGVTAGVLGRNWWHSYEARVVPVDEKFPGVSDTPEYCTVGLPIVHCVAHEYAPGRAELYVQDPATHVFHPGIGGDAVIVFDPNPEDHVSRWVMRDRGGTMSGYDARGRLRWQRDRRGDDLHFWYGEDDGDQLRTVVDPLQRVIRFAYDALGRLEHVTDFAGRTVSYRFEGEPRHPSLPTLSPWLARLMDLERAYATGALPSYLPRHDLLAEVTQAAPSINGAPPRSETWTMTYIDEEAATAAIPQPPTTSGSRELCSDGADTVDDLSVWRFQVDSLIGDLLEVRDPLGRITLQNVYDLDPGNGTFDRVLRQSYGDTAGTSTEARFDYIQNPARFASEVPSEVRDALGDGLDLLESGQTCSDVARRHVGEVLLMGATVPGAQPLVLDWPQLGILSLDARSVCAYTRFTDRAGVETWFGLNFRGQTLIEARLPTAAEGGPPVVTQTEWDVGGRLASQRDPTGRGRRWSYDWMSQNPLSRNNLVLAEDMAPDGSYRQQSWSYEPLFNQVIEETDALGRQTRHYYDYQELDIATGATMVLGYLKRWGSVATDVADLAPGFQFAVGEINGDGLTDRVRGDEIYTFYPMAMLASGVPQADFGFVQYNEFSQPTYSYRAGGRWAFFDYFRASLPTGDPVEQSSTFLDTALLGQRAARGHTGGLLHRVRTTLRQPASGAALEEPVSVAIEETNEYDLLGRVVRSGDGFGHSTTYAPDGFGDLRRIVDEDGHVTEATYDAAGDLVETAEGIDPGSIARARRTYRAWSAGGNVLAECVEAIAGRCGGGGLAAITAARSDPGASVITHTYDAEDHRIATTDPAGFTATRTFDSRGRVRLETASGGLEPIERAYDEVDRVEVEWNAVGDATSYEYDGFGRVIVERLANDTAVHRVWDLGDNLLETRIVSAGGTMLARTRYAHDERDRVWQISRWWDVPAGQLEQPGQTDEVVTTLELGEHDQPVAVTDPLGQVTTLTYDSLGRVDGMISATGQSRHQYRDPAARAVRERETDAGVDIRRVTTFDGRGHAIESRGVDSTTTIPQVAHRGWNGLGQPTEIRDPQGNLRTWAYDLAGRVSETREASDEAGVLDRVTTYEYDRRGQVSRMVDPAGVATVPTWTAAGRPFHVLTGRQGKSYYYDAAGHLRATRDSDQTEISYGWTDGQVARIDSNSPTNGSAARLFYRDGLGRTVFGYDYAGPFGVMRAVGTRRVFDSLGRIVEEGTQFYPEAARPERVVRSAWDANGGRATLRYPDGTLVVTTPDEDGRPVDLSWDGGLGHAGLSWAGNTLVREDIGHDGPWLFASVVESDGSGRAIGLEVDGPHGSIYAEQRALDGIGRLREQAQTWVGASRTRAFEYDGAGALSAAWSTPVALQLLPMASNADVAADGLARWGGAAREFQRDPTGTLLREHTGATTHYEARTSTPGDHEIAEILAPAGVSIAHDTQGRVTTDGRSQLVWSAIGRLIGATDLASGAFTEYVYDAFDRRVATITGAGTDEHVWDGWNRIAVIRNGVVTRRTIFGPGWDHPLEVDVDGVAYFPVRDIQGSVVAAVDGSGAVVESYQYDAYGNLTILDGAGAVTCEDAPPVACQPIVDHGYTGQLRDAETGLYYDKHRYYSPALRTFLSRDPLGDVDGPDEWQYVGGDPINRTDPMGLRAHGLGGMEPNPTGYPGGLHEDTIERDYANGQLNQGPGLETPGYARYITGTLALPFRALAYLGKGARKIYDTTVGPTLSYLWENREVLGHILDGMDGACGGNPMCHNGLGALKFAGGKLGSAAERATIWLERAFSSAAVTRGESGLGRARKSLPGGTGRALVGHGEYRLRSGEFVVPDGTSIRVWAPHGENLRDSVGRKIELGRFKRLRRMNQTTYTAGQKMPNYTLLPPDNLRIHRNSITVATPTDLWGLLADGVIGPNKGLFEWAACTVVRCK